MDVDIALITKLLADNNGREILEYLRHGWLTVNNIVERLDGNINQPTVSHHLGKLEESGLVVCVQRGKYRFYILNFEMIQLWRINFVQQFAPNHTQLLEPIEAVETPPAPDPILTTVSLRSMRRYKKALRRHSRYARKLLKRR